MRGLAVFLAFFAIFLVSSLVISSPLFPGNVVCFLFKISGVTSVSVLSAVVNGVFYGFIVWVVFVLSFRWVERAFSKDKLVEKGE
jgi:uncharacterized BrkB/YihY/UPF0761 family membrane protein